MMTGDPYNFVEKDKGYQRIYAAIGVVAGVLGFLGFMGGLCRTLFGDMAEVFTSLAFPLLISGFIALLFGSLCASQHRRLGMAIVCVVSSVAVIILGTLTISSLVEESQMDQRAVGTIVSVQYEEVTWNRMPRVEVTVEYTTQSGEQVTGTFFSSTGTHANGIWLEEGAQVVIYYNESKPEKVILAKEQDGS